MGGGNRVLPWPALDRRESEHGLGPLARRYLSHRMAIVARHALPTDLLFQSQVAGLDGDRGVTAQASLAPIGAEIRFRERQRILEKPAFHGMCVGGGFPGFLDTPVAAAAQLRGGRRSHIRRPSGDRSREQQQREKHGPSLGALRDQYSAISLTRAADR